MNARHEEQGGAIADPCAPSEKLFLPERVLSTFEPAQLAGSKVSPFSPHTACAGSATPSRRARGPEGRSPVRPPVANRGLGRNRYPCWLPSFTRGSGPCRLSAYQAGRRRSPVGLYAVLVRATMQAVRLLRRRARGSPVNAGYQGRGSECP